MRIQLFFNRSYWGYIDTVARWCVIGMIPLVAIIHISTNFILYDIFKTIHKEKNGRILWLNTIFRMKNWKNLLTNI